MCDIVVRNLVPPKCWYVSTRLHGIAFQKMTTFIALKASYMKNIWTTTDNSENTIRILQLAI